MSFVEKASILLSQSFSPAPVTATGLCSSTTVRAATTGRQFRTRTGARGASTSVRVATTECTPTPATTDSLFVLSKGSLNSEHK